ncbi:MAG: MurR/RpiR family transcriptional regulator [Nocardioides sp.]
MTTDATLPLGPVIANVRAVRASLNPGEQHVSDVVLTRPDWVVEATTAEVAAAAGVSTATVVRTAQKLGYRGFPHLRVLLARDVGVSSPSAPERGAGGDGVHAFFRAVAAVTESMASLLSIERVDQAVDLLSDARRVLVSGGGVSAPVAQDIAMRLAAIGRPADAPSDHLDQVIRARLLGPEDVCVIVSATGATTSILRTARAAVEAGAPVIAITAFAHSELGALATVELVTTSGTGLREELQSTFRIPQLILGNALVSAVAGRDEERTARARARVLEVVATQLTDPS